MEGQVRLILSTSQWRLIEKLCVGLTDEQAYKVLRGNAITMLELDRV